ncbi:putative EAL and GGDEF domains protein [Vibrio nigripulchritudo SO65]|uniref:RNase E specificity factor CsrD n=2 Tax=Vibrio nigripulchritudo TaxID=28173 RepID=UPI0003B1986C|nr:RNase E specificity factor CsrD [Vibrio nigripulchritudo]CCN37929.1 putative EAL and GGDEF domains protein [Vibrio nigripulchritudo AM115]CCN38947.1 putative EAL and GGDEF domains protein [Vibrio nigripulchritudo FTn2]CCN64071.1 putative EAL and GGDEF domains protein [Vibrio nigripulchritudo POn4]CCN76414.1 putative EAL and GGDEF domains protein [Vibrio nigripulchritudo SO65]
MRYTPTLKLSTRLVSFVTMIVVCAMFILFIGGTLSFKRIGQEYVHHYISGIADVVDSELDNPQAAESMAKWLPKLLQASNVLEMEVTSSSGSLYHFKDTRSVLQSERAQQLSFQLEHHSDYWIHFTVLPPYVGLEYSVGAMSSISLAVLLIVVCLIRGIKWLREQLYGSELLEERGRMILAGKTQDFEKGDLREWPYTASEALDKLIGELKDSRQERSRFDTFIRTHTFLDQLTGAANRVLFDSKLEASLQEAGSFGGIILFRVKSWEEVSTYNDKEAVDEFVVEVGQSLSNIVQRFPDVIFSRYYDSDFAILVPHQGSKEIDTLCGQLIKQISKIDPISPLSPDDWCHIGCTIYSEGERRGYILDEAETALRTAQIESVNNWSRFDKKQKKDIARGNVRWRTLFDKTLRASNIQVFSQPCFIIENQQDELLHHELFLRLKDESGAVIKASRFMAAIEQVGYETAMDRVVIQEILSWIKTQNERICYSLNINVLPFKEKAYTRWLRDELLQLPGELRKSISFEFSERSLVKNLDFIRPVIRMISGLGCKIIVHQAGRTIASTHYIKDLDVDYLKLHRSLIKKIDQRQENQLFIRSLIGACMDSKTKVIAVGVENSSEWMALKSLGIDGGQGRLFAKEELLFPKRLASKVTIGRRNRWRQKT